jgi:hypothetical protein
LKSWGSGADAMFVASTGKLEEYFHEHLSMTHRAIRSCAAPALTGSGPGVSQAIRWRCRCSDRPVLRDLKSGGPQSYFFESNRPANPCPFPGKFLRMITSCPMRDRLPKTKQSAMGDHHPQPRRQGGRPGRGAACRTHRRAPAAPPTWLANLEAEGKEPQGFAA